VIAKIGACYTKLIGLPYLWKALALPIHELNDIGAGDSEDNGSKFEKK
jgi:hypothetical protein